MLKISSVFILSILCLLFCFSCKTAHTNDNDVENSIKKINYLALGDSYTIGESVKISERYPIQLVKEIEFLSKNNTKNKDRVYFEEPQIIAKTGWTCEELMTAIHLAEQKKDFKPNYDMVSLLIGVNDQYRNYDSALYEKRFEKLLEKAIAFAGKDASKVFVISIPDWGVTQYAKNKKFDAQKVAKEIDFYNKINKKITLKHKVRYFDITSISREAVSDKNLIANDGLHPSGKMYKRWVELMTNDIFWEILK